MVRSIWARSAAEAGAELTARSASAGQRCALVIRHPLSRLPNNQAGLPGRLQELQGAEDRNGGPVNFSRRLGSVLLGLAFLFPPFDQFSPGGYQSVQEVLPGPLGDLPVVPDLDHHLTQQLERHIWIVWVLTPALLDGLLDGLG